MEQPKNPRAWNFAVEVAGLCEALMESRVDDRAAVQRLMSMAMDYLQGSEDDFLIRPERRAREIHQLIDDLIAGKYAGVPTPWPDLNEALNGGLRSGPIVVAARTAGGKSTMMYQMAEHAALRGYTVLYVSTEMVHQQFAVKTLAQKTADTASQIWRGEIRDPDRAHGVADMMGRQPLYFRDAGKIDTAAVYSTALRLREEVGKLDLVVVDYMQLLRDPSGRGGSVERIETIANNLMEISRNLDLPLVMGCQINRGGARMNTRPVLEDFKGSGNIEQNAAVAMALHPLWDSRSDLPRPEVIPTDLTVLKNRLGAPETSMLLMFETNKQYFRSPRGGEAGPDDEERRRKDQAAAEQEARVQYQQGGLPDVGF